MPYVTPAQKKKLEELSEEIQSTLFNAQHFEESVDREEGFGHLAPLCRIHAIQWTGWVWETGQLISLLREKNVPTEHVVHVLEAMVERLFYSCFSDVSGGGTEEAKKEVIDVINPMADSFIDWWGPDNVYCMAFQQTLDRLKKEHVNTTRKDNS
jgi:hypothetical protein